MAAPPVPDWKTEYIQQEYTQRGCSTRLEDRVHSAIVHSAWLLHQTGRQSIFTIVHQRGCSTRLEDIVHSARVHSAWILHRYQTGKRYTQQEYTTRGCSSRLEDSTFGKSTLSVAAPLVPDWKTEYIQQKIHSAWLLHQTGRQYIRQEYTQPGCSTRLEDRVRSARVHSAWLHASSDWKTVHSARVHSAWLLHRYQTGRQCLQQEYTQRGCSTRLKDRVHSARVHSAWLLHQTGGQSTFTFSKSTLSVAASPD